MGQPNSTPAVPIAIKWQSRTVAFSRTSVQDIKAKACAYFRLGPVGADLVLMGYVDGMTCEITDDSLGHLPPGAVVTLLRIPREGSRDSGDETAYEGDEGQRRGFNNTGTFRTRPGQTYRGGKPVIYLFPPSTLSDATVSVSLIPQWNFTHIYPLTETKALDHGGQRVSWSVSAEPDGTLVERGTGLELSYLFWEAISIANHAGAVPPSPPSSPPPSLDQNDLRDDSDEHFDPAYPSLTPDSPTAVILPYGQLLPYLDRALEALSLHTAARNDFITYWLPALSKKPYVALRFLPQRAYERAAALDVAPSPDIVTRVFMLFRGVAAEEAGLWAAASERVEKVDWVEVVGVRPGAWDESVFRVLEWGGMEVL